MTHAIRPVDFDNLKTMTYEVTDRVARITFNRPEKGNAIIAEHERGTVGVRVDAALDQLVEARAVGELRGAGRGLAHDVGVGQQEPVAGEDHAGAEALAAAVTSALPPAGHAEAGDLGREPFGHAGDDL